MKIKPKNRFSNYILISILILSSLLMVSCEKEDKLITSEEMITAQIEFNESMYPIIDEMVDSYNDYIAYEMSEKEFRKRVKNYKERFEDIQGSYFEFMNKYKLETSTEELSEIIFKFEKSREHIQSIINGTIVNDEVLERENIHKLYLEGSDKMETEVESIVKLIENM